MPDSIRVYTYPNVFASFPGGGDTALFSFIRKNVQYPEDARQKGIAGYVIVQSVVEKDGTLTHVGIIPGRGLYPSLDQAAIDVIHKSPLWIPGKIGGVPVRSTRAVRVVFKQHADTTFYLVTDTAHVDTPPEFEGGPEAFVRFLVTHMPVSDASTDEAISFEFIIEKDGSLTNVRILRLCRSSQDHI